MKFKTLWMVKELVKPNRKKIIKLENRAKAITAKEIETQEDGNSEREVGDVEDRMMYQLYTTA